MESVFVATEIHNIYQVQCMFVGEFATELCQHIVTIAVCHTWSPLSNRFYFSIGPVSNLTRELNCIDLSGRQWRTHQIFFFYWRRGVMELSGSGSLRLAQFRDPRNPGDQKWMTGAFAPIIYSQVVLCCSMNWSVKWGLPDGLCWLLVSWFRSSHFTFGRDR